MVSIYRKEDRILTFTVTDGGVAVDISGSTISFKVSKRFGQTTPTLTVDGAIVGDGSAGQCTVTLTDTQTDITEGNYVYELEVTLSSGLVYIAKQDYFTVKRRVEV